MPLKLVLARAGTVVTDNPAKAALIYGAFSLFSTLFGALIGVWGGRELMMTQIQSSAVLIEKLTNTVQLLTIQVEKTSMLGADVRGRVESIESWRVGIQDDRIKRGETIPRLESDLMELRRRIDKIESETRRSR